MTAGSRVLVVEDDPGIRELLREGLRHAGFEVIATATGREAEGQADRARPDLVLLDVMLPDIDGLLLAERLIHVVGPVPVVFVTARDSTADKIAGLARGDDYVTKPFSMEEVLARIRAVLRRSRGWNAPRPRLTVADLELDEETQEAWRAGEPIRLSPTEFKLLRYFMINQGRVLSKAQILDHVWNYDFGGDGNIVESYVSYLRRKIDTKEPKLIHTLRGVGYVLRPPRE